MCFMRCHQSSLKLCCLWWSSWSQRPTQEDSFTSSATSVLPPGVRLHHRAEKLHWVIIHYDHLSFLPLQQDSYHHLQTAYQLLLISYYECLPEHPITKVQSHIHCKIHYWDAKRSAIARGGEYGAVAQCIKIILFSNAQSIRGPWGECKYINSLINIFKEIMSETNSTRRDSIKYVSLYRVKTKEHGGQNPDESHHFTD